MPSGLTSALIGPLEQEELDHLLKREFPAAHFFCQDDFESQLHRFSPRFLILLEPLQRAMPEAVWHCGLPRLGLGSCPPLLWPGRQAQVQELLQALDAFLPLGDAVRTCLPTALPVSSTTLWLLGETHFSVSEPEIYPLMVVSKQGWSPWLAAYESLQPAPFYFFQVNPIRLPFYLQRAQMVLLDEEKPHSLHFQVLAAGAQLLVPECLVRQEPGLASYLEPERDFSTFNHNNLQQQVQRAFQLPGRSKAQNAETLQALQSQSLRNTLPQALQELKSTWQSDHSAALQPGLELQARQVALGSASSGIAALGVLDTFLPRFSGSSKLEYAAFLYLTLLHQSLTGVTNLPQDTVRQRAQRVLQALPPGLYGDLATFYWAYQLQHHELALRHLEAGLETWSSLSPAQLETELDRPAPWQRELVLGEILELKPGLEGLQFWLHFCRAYLLAQLKRYEEALSAIEALLQENYFPSGGLLWLRLQEVRPDSALEMLKRAAEHWLQVNPCFLELAFAWIRALAPTEPERALAAIEHYRSLCQRLSTRLNSLADLIQLQQDLDLPMARFDSSPSETIPSRPYLLWEGPLYAHSSLATINRHWLEALAATDEIALSYIPYEPPEWPPDPEPQAWDQIYLQKPDVYLSHRWPPREHPPAAGKWVSIIPWEFGVIPQNWSIYLNALQDEIWMPSSFVAQSFAISGVDPERLRVIPNGVETDLYCPEGPRYPFPSAPKASPDTRVKLLFVGGTIYRKGFDLLLKAYRQAFSADDEVLLVIKSFGAGNHYAVQALQENEAQNNRSAEVLVLDADLDTKEMAALYRSCDCYVHPYRGEGFGMPILEAMASGLPVIVPDAGPAPEFCPLEAGWRVPTRIRFEASQDVQGLGLAVGHPYFTEVDLDALVETLRIAVRDTTGRQRRGKAARTAALAYDWQVIFPQVRSAIQNLAQKPFAHRERTQWIRRQMRTLAEAEPEQRSDLLQAALESCPESVELLGAATPICTASEWKRHWCQALRSGLALDAAQSFARTHTAPWPNLPLKVQTVSESATLLLPPLRPSPRLQPQTTAQGAELSLSLGKRAGRLSDPTVSKIQKIFYWVESQWPEEIELSELESGTEIWCAHPHLRTGWEARDHEPEQILYLPLAVDFEHFRPGVSATVWPESAGRFVFLSIFDWERDGHWQDLLRAYFQAFEPCDAVNLMLQPYGQDFDRILAELTDWMETAGFDAEAVPELSLLQEELDLETLPGLYAGAHCFVSAQAAGSGLWALAAQASGLPVISTGHFPFLQRPFSELFQAGDHEHLTWLLRQLRRDLPAEHGLRVRQYLQREHDASRWQERVEDHLLRSRLCHLTG